MKNKRRLEKASHKELALKLDVAVCTIAGYPKIKRYLMLLGLKVEQNYLKKINPKDN